MRPSSSFASEHIIKKVFLQYSTASDWRIALPRLTDSGKLNLEIYAFFALACRQFVSSWHTAIISDDDEFLSDLCSIVARLVHVLEERIQKLKLSDVLLDDIPYLLETHISNIRVIKDRISCGLLPSSDLERAFHALRPIKALDSIEKELAFNKILSEKLAGLLLAKNEADSPCASAFVSALFSDIILGNLTDKLAQPWMIHDIALKIIDNTRKKQLKLQETSSSEKKASGNGQPIPVFPVPSTAPLAMQIQQLQRKASQISADVINKCGNAVAFLAPLLTESSQKDTTAETPLTVRSILSLFSSLFRFPERNPLLTSLLSIVTSPLRYGVFSGLSSRIASSFIHKKLGNPLALAEILRISRDALFSCDGYLGPPRIIPSPDEQIEKRAQLVEELTAVVPDKLRALLYGSTPKESVEEIVSLFDSAVINKHLIYTTLEYLLVSLFPEVGCDTALPEGNL